MKRPLSALGSLLLLSIALGCGGRTDLSEFLPTDSEETLDGSGGAESSTGGRAGSGGASTGGGGTSTGGTPSSGGSPSITRCPRGEFDADTLSNESTCRPWSNCGPGEYVAVAPSTTTDRQCSTCPLGRFSTVDNARECQDWSVCKFGETTFEQGTSSSDVVCRSPDTFAAVPFEYRLEAAGMTATALGIYLGLNVVSAALPIVLRESLDGTTVMPFEVPSEEGGLVTDLTSLGTDIYVAAATGASNGIEGRTPRLVKFDAEGQALVVLDLEQQPDEWLLNILVTSDGVDVIVARQVLPVDCTSGSDCAPGVESNLILSRFDQNLTQISEIRHVGYFNFASIGDLEVSGGRIFLSGELTGNSGIHVFDADGSVLKKYDDIEVSGSVGYIIAPHHDGSAFCVMSEAGPTSSNLTVVDGFMAQPLGQVPHTDTDSMLDMIATEQGLFLLANERNIDDNVFLELDHGGQMLSRRVEENDFTYLSEMALGVDGELFVGGVGDDAERHVAVIRPWQR